MAKFKRQAGVFIIFAMCAGTFIVLISCGGRGTGKGLESKGAVQVSNSGDSIVGSGTDKSRKLGALIAEIDAYVPPAEVDSAIFDELKNALAAALSERMLAEGTDRIVASPPQGDSGKVTDFAYDIEANVLKWQYANKGDYDLSGEVGIPDITPVALNYGAIVHDPESRAAWVDGDGNGEVGISDITPIALAYLNSVAGYRILTSETEGGEFVQVGEIVPFGEGGVFPKLFEVTPPEGVNSFVAVEPVDAEGVPGARSDILDLGAPPQIVSVSPLTGFKSEIVRFIAEVTGVEPITYEWNFGGGGLPDISGESSPFVTLGEGGVYSASLTVSNLLGSDIFNFEYTIEEPANAGPGDWAMFGRDVKRNRRSPYAISEVADYLWVAPAGDSVYSSPAIAADGTVYFGSLDRFLYAVTADGEPLWQFETLGSIFSSPAVGPDGGIYFGCDDDNLYALNSDGSLKWKFLTGGDIDSCPAIGGDGTVYFGSWDNSFYAVNPDGSLKWSYETGGWILSSPAIAEDGTIYIGSDDDNLYALNPDGSLKWFYPAGGDIDSSPAIAEDGTVYFSCWDGFFYALNPGGSLKWRYETGGIINASPAIGADGTIYFGGYDGIFYALTPEGGIRWSEPLSFYIHSSPAIDSNGNVYFGGFDGVVYAFTAGGDLIWSYLFGGSFASSPAIGDNGILYICYETGLFSMG